MVKSIYTHRAENIMNTWLLFALFFGVVIAVGFVFSSVYNTPAILYGAVIISLLMNLGAYWYSGKVVLGMAGARLVEEADNPELYRVVENLAITAGLPTPKIYIVKEVSPNAFATGRDPKHAVVAVTTGLLERLDRTELEGVLAHELAHIGNRDMLLQTAVVVLVGLVAVVSDMFMRSWLWGGFRQRNDNNNQGQAVMFILAMGLAVLAPIVATLMRLAISRRREYLADASGALLTRYPEGLARALEKISRDKQPMRIASNATAHLWIEDPFVKNQKGSRWHQLYMTHPPVEERIRRLREMGV